MSGHGSVPAEDLTAASAVAPSPSLCDESYLAYLVPADSHLDLEHLFANSQAGKAVLDSIAQRQALFFDETVDVLLMLKLPWLEERELQAHVSRLLISLQAQIVNANASGRDSATPSSETIFTGHVEEVGDPLVIVHQEETGPGESDTSQHVYAIWKLPVFLARPRMRPLNPSVVLTASASLRGEPAAGVAARGSGYLASGLPASANLLQSFVHDAQLAGASPPHLSALRVSRVTPLTGHQEAASRLRALPQLKLPIFPVIHTRVRFSRPNVAPASATIVSLLEVDLTAHFECEVLLDKVSLLSPDASVESLDQAPMKLPLACHAHDHISFLHVIKPTQSPDRPRPVSSTLDISLSAVVKVSPAVCEPRLSIKWSTALDFTTPVNPSFAPSETGIRRPRRPSQLSIGSATAETPLRSQGSMQPDALPALEASATRSEAAIPDLGITMSFTRPCTPIYPGDVFSWTVYVVNRSSDRSGRPARKLALVAMAKRRRNELRPLRPPSTATRRRGDKEVADAVLDDNVLHAMHKSSLVDAADVICLSADARVGPLGPGACHVTELQFLALRQGIVDIEAVRVIDLNTQEHVDIRDLPTVMIEPVP
ncbi:hypothetical protein CDD82_7009 [Ophiocordyceps australis]|uniref:Trafficking protein particle complex II-specific subunit 65 IgD3 domain-containing protein n=1 Tax=Ophiocordyceps australis TaxID=1399860 RepID=A0A2C5YM88_9HYPO|nr:hypothetical protein CDD82_7009 [Ophiocordyceps australis]